MRVLILGAVLSPVSLCLDDGLTVTSWAQRYEFAQYAPMDSTGAHERLGCQSTAIAQIMYYHRLCPTGYVSYTALGFPNTSMDFDKEARTGLCKYSSMAAKPLQGSLAMKFVAKYEYAASLIVEKKWGTGSYMLSHDAAPLAVERHYNVRVQVVPKGQAREHSLSAIREDLARKLPLKMHIHSTWANLSFPYHHVVVDGYEENAGKRNVHLNIGHSGYDNGWYDYDAPICLQYAPDGSRNYHCYDDLSYHELWRIQPQPLGIIV